MKAAFIYTPKPYLVNPNAQVGLGLLSLATMAESAGAEVTVANCQTGDWRTAVKAAGEVDVVCMSGCLPDITTITDTAAGIKIKWNRRAPYVIVGGPAAKSPHLFGWGVDAIVDGPGEEFIAAAVAGERVYGYIREPEPLDYCSYPIPDRTLLGEHTGGEIFHASSGVKAERSTTLLTSRGCRYHCAFCASGTGGMFEYPLDRIDRELSQIAALGIKSVRISDDNIISDRKRMTMLCQLLKDYGMRWRASLRTTPHDRLLYEIMVDCGCVELSFGVESADPAVLRLLNKGAVVQDADEACYAAKNAGIPNVRALFMMNTPGETRHTLNLNKEWADRHPDVTICLTAFYPFPGTAIARHPLRFDCRIEQSSNPNIYVFRADGSEPESHISIIDGLSRDELTQQLLDFREHLEQKGSINHG